ncbi:MAG: ATP-dependent RNA helicase HrpA [Acidimicrobiales bacterium]
MARRFSDEQKAKREASVPRVRYPDLPISERRDDLLATIEANQVVIVSGETGSGKSTQLPKMCLELGRGIDGFIGHTQPRRLAARSIAERVASELDSTVGELVGYTVRFTDQVGPTTLIKLMTDGILLAEMQRDRQLRRYDTIIIDEAHERSLNIDFLLGYLRQLLPRRPDLKVIITSATIDTEKFSHHFGGAPIIEVSGRTYPVELRYQPLDGSDTPGERREVLDQTEGIAAAVKELQREGPGDILTFLSGEREIREAADVLEGLKLPNTEIVPLYARLSAAEQHRVFADHKRRRIVLATNVAETSLTVPGIRYVIDAGTARISRYSSRTKVQRLPIEAISQASANQRSGRCGRLGPGIAIRLYEEDDFDARPEFTDPEIQRTSLASVILQMASLGLGKPEEFPFVDPPDSRNIRDGVLLLEELDAVDPEHVGTKRWLTPLGRQLAKLPVDPRFGRMVLDAADYGCVHELMVITAGMSVQDVRDRPREKQQLADESHKRFDHPESDFLSIIKLWDYVTEQRKELSQGQFRRLCRREFLNFNRVREWQDIYRQLARVAKELDLAINASPAESENIHRSVLAGLLSHIGMRDGEKREYKGARGSRFVIARGSVFHGASPQWVMAGELVETNRMWARRVARIRPEWIEKAAEHLVRRSYGDPWWDDEQGAALTHEKVSLYGLPIVSKRRVQVGRIDPAMAREWFIHHALIENEWQASHSFIEHNAEVLEELRDLGARHRSNDVSVDYDRLFRFYDERLDSKVTSAGDFGRWWSQERKRSRNLLDLTLEKLLDPGEFKVDDQQFPEVWTIAGLDLLLTYEFAPGSDRDGVVVNLPVGSLDKLDASQFEWNVPGTRAELIIEVIRSLPKQLRRSFVPVPDTVAAILPDIDPARGGVVDEVRKALAQRYGVLIGPESFDLSAVSSHLRPTFRVFDSADNTLAEGDDLAAVTAEVGGQVKQELTEATHELERHGETSWVFGTIPPSTTATAAGGLVTVYPALIDEGNSVGLELFTDEAEQATAMWAGVRRLLQLNSAGQAKMFRQFLTNEMSLTLLASPYASSVDFYNDALAAALDGVLRGVDWLPVDEAAFAALVDRGRSELSPLLTKVGRTASEVLVTVSDIRGRLAAIENRQLQASATDAGDHLDRLVYPGFIQGVGAHRVDDVLRYVMAIDRRLENLAGRVRQDVELMGRCRSLENEVHRTLDVTESSAQSEDLVWMLEEFRVSCFAQQVGTSGPVSEKRIRKALHKL